MVGPLAVIHLSGTDALHCMISSLLEIIVSYILPFGCRCYYFRHGDKSGPCDSLQRLKLRNHVFYFIQLTFKQPPAASATILQSSYHTIRLKTKETNSLLFKCQNPPLSSVILCYLEAETRGDLTRVQAQEMSSSNARALPQAQEGSCLCSHFKSKDFGTSLMVQWLRLCTSSEGGPGLILGQGTRPHMLQLTILAQPNKLINQRKRKVANSNVR